MKTTTVVAGNIVISEAGYNDRTFHHNGHSWICVHGVPFKGDFELLEKFILKRCKCGRMEILEGDESIIVATCTICNRTRILKASGAMNAAMG